MYTPQKMQSHNAVMSNLTKNTGLEVSNNMEYFGRIRNFILLYHIAGEKQYVTKVKCPNSQHS